MSTFISGFPNALTGQPIDENSKAISGVFKNISSGNGTVTTSGTPVQLNATSTEAKVVDIYNSNLTSGDSLIIGGTNVSYSSNRGITLLAGGTYRIQITDLSKVWIDAQNNGDTFQYTYFW